MVNRAVVKLRAIANADVPRLDAHGDPEMEGSYNDFGQPATTASLQQAVRSTAIEPYPFGMKRSKSTIRAASVT